MNQKYRIILLVSAFVLPLLVFHIGAEDNPPKKPAATANTLYDPNPNHLWNRLYAALFIRTGADGTEYGFDSLDPLLWPVSKHLLVGESHKEAIRVLDEFLNKHGEKMIQDPLKRAIMQHDLWAVFDWYWQSQNERALSNTEFPEQAEALATRLAKIIRRLALTKEQIQALPDNYAAAVSSKAFPEAFNAEKTDVSFLPPDLWKADGPWVCVKLDNAGLAAPIHTQQFGSRSAFLIFVNLPKGREDTLDYLKRLDGARWGDTAKSQFPPGTTFALARRMLLIDDKGDIVASPLTMSVQMRVYPSIADQSDYEFKLQREKLFTGESGGLCAAKKDEKDFSFLLMPGSDPIESGKGNQRGYVLDCSRCHCHAGAGIESVASYTQPFSTRAEFPPSFSVSDPKSICDFTIAGKKDQFTWGLLKGLWQNEK